MKNPVFGRDFSLLLYQMKILLTGANGFLGVHLAAELSGAGYELICTGRSEQAQPKSRNPFVYKKMDFTDPYQVHDVFEKYQPAVVIHAGAMTKVDECEKNQWDCYTTNVEGTLTLLSNSYESKSFFIFISTDFVFDGESGNYTEQALPSPVNFYGKSKADAEEAVREYEYEWAIVRTSLVYGKPVNAENIISLVKKKLEHRESYGLVNDQVRSPTYVEDLAKGIVSIVAKQATGIYHLSGKDILTPYQMGIEIASMLGAVPTLLDELDQCTFSQPARRPSKTNLSIKKAINDLGYNPLSFKEGLEKTIARINSN